MQFNQAHFHGCMQAQTDEEQREQNAWLNQQLQVCWPREVAALFALLLRELHSPHHISSHACVLEQEEQRLRKQAQARLEDVGQCVCVCVRVHVCVRVCTCACFCGLCACVHVLVLAWLSPAPLCLSLSAQERIEWQSAVDKVCAGTSTCVCALKNTHMCVHTRVCAQF